MSENTESIHIHELDEDGAQLAAEIEAELEQAARTNPWFVALWSFNGVMLLLAVLGVFTLFQLTVSTYSQVNEGGIQQRAEQFAWASALAPYANICLLLAGIGVLAALIIHALSWERRRRG